MEGALTNSNFVIDTSFVSSVCISNRSEFSDEDYRDELSEDIAAGENDNIQLSTSHSPSEGRNIDDWNKKQRNSTLRRIYLPLEIEVRFEEGCDTKGEVGHFYDATPAIEESSVEEEYVCCNWREEEERFNEVATETHEKTSDGNVDNDDNDFNDNNDANLVPTSKPLEDVNMMQENYLKVQPTARSIAVSKNIDRNIN